MKRYESPDEEWILGHADRIQRALTRPTPILELGCGPGRDTRLLLQMANVIAIDRNPQALAECAVLAPAAWRIRADIRSPFPFRTQTFSVVIASLSLHYFSWRRSTQIVDEISRCLHPSGLLIVRVNSVNDVNHGADSPHEIEANYLKVGAKRKRFFDEESIRHLFNNWRFESVREQEIIRFVKPKWVWEVILRKEI